MILDARDRVLHHALKLVHQDQPPVDLTAEIVAAWERGVRGSGVPEEGPDEELLEEREVRQVASRTLAPPTWLIAASVAAAGGLAVWTFGVRGRATGGESVAAVPEAGSDAPPESGGPAVLALVTDADRALFAKAFDAVTGKLYDWAGGMPAPVGPGGDESPADELAGLLGAKPALWSELEARTLAFIEASPEPPTAAGRLLDLIAFDPSDAALDVARDIWMEAPEVFTEEHIVTLAERGAFEFEREVVERVAGYTPGSTEEPVLAAAYLAFRGSEDAVTFLLQHPLEDFTDKGALQTQAYLAAAIALDFQRHPEPWSRIKRAVAAEAESALERGELDMARLMALGLEFFARARAEGEVMELGALPVRVLRYYAERADDLQRPEDVRNLLDAL